MEKMCMNITEIVLEHLKENNQSMLMDNVSYENFKDYFADEIKEDSISEAVDRLEDEGYTVLESALDVIECPELIDKVFEFKDSYEVEKSIEKHELIVCKGIGEFVDLHEKSLVDELRNRKSTGVKKTCEFCIKSSVTYSKKVGYCIYHNVFWDIENDIQNEDICENFELKGE